MMIEGGSRWGYAPVWKKKYANGKKLLGLKEQSVEFKCEDFVTFEFEGI